MTWINFRFVGRKKKLDAFVFLWIDVLYMMRCYLLQQWRAFYHLQLEDESHLHQEKSLVAGTPAACSGRWNVTVQVWNQSAKPSAHLAENSFSHLPCGRRMLLTPPSLTLIFKHRLERVWGVVFWTFFTCTHCVAMPRTVSPTRFTSAATQDKVWGTNSYRNNL